MIYQPKPQRGGRSIITNTNNPPQDPPPPPIEIIPPIKISEKSVEFSVSGAGPEPPTPEPVKVKPKRAPKKVTTPKKKPVVTVTAKIVKLTFREKIFRFLKKIFRRV